MIKALKYLITYILFQIFTTIIVLSIWHIFKGENISAVIKAALAGTLPASTLMIILIQAATNIILFIVFYYFKWCKVSPNYLRMRQWSVFLWCVIAAIGTVIPSMYMQEFLPSMPDSIHETFAKIMDNRYGYITLCIITPIIEETVFRGAILRALKENINNSWVAIIVSAIIFSVIHINFAQMPHAFLMGIFFGWIYLRTNSILPGIAMHWVNNTIAYATYKIAPQMSNMSLSEILGNNTTSIALSIIFSLCILIPAIFQLNIRMKSEIKKQ